MAPDSNRYKFIIQVLKQDPEFSNLFSSKHDSKITEDYLKFLAIACHYCVGREDLKTLLNNTIEDRSEAASILRKITSKEHQVIKEYKIEKLDEFEGAYLNLNQLIFFQLNQLKVDKNDECVLNSHWMEQ